MQLITLEETKKLDKCQLMQDYSDDVAEKRQAKQMFKLGTCLAEIAYDDGLSKDELLGIIDDVKLMIERG